MTEPTTDPPPPELQSPPTRPGYPTDDDVQRLVAALLGPAAALLTTMSSGFTAVIRTLIDAAYQQGRSDASAEAATQTRRGAPIGEAPGPPGGVQLGGVQVVYGAPQLGTPAQVAELRRAASRRRDPA